MKTSIQLLLCSVLSLLWSNQVAAQAPTNDACANAIVLGTICIPASGTTENANDEQVPGECTISALPTAANSVWYVFQATSATQTVVVQGLTIGAVMFDPVVAAFDDCGGISPSGGECIDNTNDGAAETLQLTGLTIGNSYYIQVHDFYRRTTANCQFTICVFNTPPVNDVCTTAILLPANASCTPISGTTENANDEQVPGECTISALPTTANSVWYVFEATVAIQTVVVQGLTIGAIMFDPVVAVFDDCGGISPSGGECIDNTNDGGAETLQLTGLTVGHPYYIQVHDFYRRTTADCQFTICVFETATSNACTQAIALTPGISCTPVAGTTENATNDYTSGACTIGAAANSVLYEFAAPSPNQTLTVTGVAGFDAVVGVFAGCGGASPAGGECTNNTGDQAAETLHLTGLTIGATYYIQVYDVEGDLSPDSDFNICLFGPVNDLCENAIVFPPISTDGTSCATVTANTAGATGTDNTACAGNEDDDVWYSFTVPVGYVSLFYTMTNVSGSSDRALQVFSGSCPGTAAGCFGAETGFLTGLTGGTTYLLRAYTVGTGTVSNFNICLRTPVANDECTGAVSITSTPGTFVNPGQQASGFASQSQPPITCNGNTSSFANDIWYSFRTDADGGDMTISVTPTGNADLILEGYTTAGSCSGASVCANASGNSTETITMNGLSVHGGGSADNTATYYFRVYRFNSQAPYSFNIMASGTALSPALPLELAYFTGQVQGAVNALNWETLSEKNVQFHAVERSVEGIRWREIGRKNGLTNSSLPIQYTLEDRQPPATAYYRLQSVDFDGQESLSTSVILVRKGQFSGITGVFPSPAKADVTVQFTALQETKVTVQMRDMTGRLVLSQIADAIQGANEWPLLVNGLPAGVYAVTITDDTGPSAPVRFIKQ